VLTIEAVKRARAVLDNQPVPASLCAWLPSAVVKAHCEFEGIAYAPDKNGVIKIGDVTIFITDLRIGCFASDHAIIEAMNADA
jgi:hypothetical protein